MEQAFRRTNVIPDAGLSSVAAGSGAPLETGKRFVSQSSRFHAPAGAVKVAIDIAKVLLKFSWSAQKFMRDGWSRAHPHLTDGRDHETSGF